MYNKAATNLRPPRPPFDWTTISHYNFLDEFELLKDTRNDVSERPWTQSDIRELMRQLRRIDRAREEVVCCTVQAQRLYTSIADEHDVFRAVLEKMEVAKDPLYAVMYDFCERRVNVNMCHIERLQQMAGLPGFAGSLARGHRKSSSFMPSSSTPSLSTPSLSTPSSSTPSSSMSDPIASLPARAILTPAPTSPTARGQPDVVLRTPAASLTNVHSTVDDSSDEDEEEVQGDIGGLVEYMSQASSK